MKNETIPVINQVIRDAALAHLTECGLPESLIDGVDCTTIESMEETLMSTKNCFYASIRKHIEETYGVKEEHPEGLLRQMEYKEKDYWRMFDTIDCKIEHNKYIADLCNAVSANMNIEAESEEAKALCDKQRLIYNILRTGIDEELVKRFDQYIDLEGEIKGAIEKEFFILGFRTAYHLLEECRN